MIQMCNIFLNAFLSYLKTCISETFSLVLPQPVWQAVYLTSCPREKKLLHWWRDTGHEKWLLFGPAACLTDVQPCNVRSPASSNMKTPQWLQWCVCLRDNGRRCDILSPSHMSSPSDISSSSEQMFSTFTSISVTVEGKPSGWDAKCWLTTMYHSNSDKCRRLKSPWTNDVKEGFVISVWLVPRKGF